MTDLRKIDALIEAVEDAVAEFPAHAVPDTPLDGTPYVKRHNLTLGHLRKIRAILRDYRAKLDAAE